MAQLSVSKLLKAVGVSDHHILPFAAYQLGYETVQASDLGEYLSESLGEDISAASRLYLGCISAISGQISTRRIVTTGARSILHEKCDNGLALGMNITQR